MTIALHPTVHTGHSVSRLWRTSRVAEKGLTMIPVVGNMHDIQKGATLVVHEPAHREVTCLQGALAHRSALPRRLSGGSFSFQHTPDFLQGACAWQGIFFAQKT